jgi:hypothetical protein
MILRVLCMYTTTYLLVVLLLLLLLLLLSLSLLIHLVERSEVRNGFYGHMGFIIVIV